MRTWMLALMKLRTGLALCVLAPGLVACSITTDTAVTDSSAVAAICREFPAISWSKTDTPETIAEVKVHNARRDGFCQK